jgi:hypothetical protein
MKYKVIEYKSSADTHEVEAKDENHAEDLVANGYGTLISVYEEHDFYEVEEIK